MCVQSQAKFAVALKEIMLLYGGEDINDIFYLRGAILVTANCSSKTTNSKKAS